MSNRQMDNGAVYYGAEKPEKGIVIYLHSLTQGPETPFAQAAIAKLIGAGFGVLAFTFKFLRDGSDPSKTLESESAQLISMIAFVKERFGVDEIALVGKSLGGCIALIAANSSKEIQKIVILGLPLALGFPPRVELLKGAKTDNFDAVAEYGHVLRGTDCPVHLIQGAADDLGSITDCEKLSSQNMHVTLDRIPNADHSFMANGVPAWNACFEKMLERIQ